MKMVSTKNGTHIPVSNEELRVIDKIKENNFLSETELDSRSLTLADKMVARGIIDKKKIKSIVYYTTFKGENK